MWNRGPSYGIDDQQTSGHPTWACLLHRLDQKGSNERWGWITTKLG